MRRLLLLTLLIGLLPLTSCKEESAPLPTAPKKKDSGSINKKISSIDILVPEVQIEESEQTKNLELNDLWDHFFASYVVRVGDENYDARVDFKLMHEKREQRDEDFLKLVALIEKRIATTDIQSLSSDEKKAFYLNAYNYTSLRLVNKGYLKKDKIITSIRDLSANFYPYEIFLRDVVPFQDGIKSLDHLNKKEIKPLFLDEEGKGDVRFIFALNGATMSRGLLLNEAFRAEKLDQQLEFLTKSAIKLKRFAKVEDQELKMARIIKWYKKEIETNFDSLKNFFEAYGINKGDYRKTGYQDFNWDLNSLALYPLPVATEQKPTIDPIVIEDQDFFEEGACDYLKTEDVTVIGHCNQVVDGQLNGAYKYPTKVVSASLCLYQRKLSDKKTSLGIIGDIAEVADERNPVTQDLAVEGKAKKKKYGLRMRIIEGLITTLEFDTSTKRLMVRQTKSMLGGGIRKFSLQCE